MSFLDYFDLNKRADAAYREARRRNWPPHKVDLHILMIGSPTPKKYKVTVDESCTTVGDIKQKMCNKFGLMPKYWSIYQKPNGYGRFVLIDDKLYIFEIDISRMLYFWPGRSS